MSFFPIILTVRIFFDSVNYLKSKKSKIIFGSLILFSNGDIMEASWKRPSFAGRGICSVHESWCIWQILKAFALPQWWQQTHRKPSVNYKGADLVNEGMVSEVTFWYIPVLWHSQPWRSKKSLWGVPVCLHPASITPSQTDLWLHTPPQLAWAHRMLPLQGCRCPWKARRGSARDFLWGCSGIVAVPGTESSPTMLFTAVAFWNMEPEGNTWNCWHFAPGSEKIWSAPLPLISHLNICSTHGGSVQGTPVLSLP